MAMSKRRKAILEDREKAEEWRMEYFKKVFGEPKPEPPPPWTAAQLADLDKMASLLRHICHAGYTDLDSLREFMGFSHYFGGNSLRIVEIQRRFEHYQTLNQEAAKEKLWRKIYDTLYGLQTEMAQLKSMRGPNRGW